MATLVSVGDRELAALANLGGIAPEGEAATFLENKRRRCVGKGCGFWAVYADGQSLPCGYTALFQETIEGLPYPLLDVWFTDDAWVENVPLSATEETLRRGVTEGEFYYIATLLNRNDERAIPLAAELGMQFYCDVTYDGRVFQLYQYVRPLLNRSYATLSAYFYDLQVPLALAEEVAFYETRLKSIQGPILEAMCGSGRLLIPLLQKGISIEGVDNSPAMLERCRLRAAALGISSLTLYQQAVQELSLPKHYAAVFIPFNSIQCVAGQAEVLAALRHLRDHMDPGGLLLVETHIPTWSIVNYHKPVVFNQTFEIPGGTLTCASCVVVNLPKQFLSLRKRYQKIIDGNVTLEETEDMTVYWYYRQEMGKFLQQTGFSLTTVYNRPYQGAPFSQIYEARAV